ncbi:hypothetical protein CASFOL_035203 [Castilleja foliolosa]|uniref:Uncharacterized protein n=1 Tax=Castilleja foliolosa TaxID=1961234 RepID=A0ABD3BTJ6_9LAMI
MGSITCIGFSVTGVVVHGLSKTDPNCSRDGRYLEGCLRCNGLRGIVYSLDLDRGWGLEHGVLAGVGSQ